MKRTDLHQDPAKSLGKLLKGARGVGEAAHTRPTGIVHLGDGDVVWENGDGLTSVKDLPSAIDVEKLLQEGLTTETRRTTVSTSQPSATDGFPEGAYWTQTTTASDNTVKGVWKLTDGQWVAQDLPSTNLTAFPYADIGLLNVAVLSAQIITSGYFRTATTGKRIEIDSSGVRAYNASGQNTVNLTGVDNLITGTFRTAMEGSRAEINANVFGTADVGLYMFAGSANVPAALRATVAGASIGTTSLTSASIGGRDHAELRMSDAEVRLMIKGIDAASKVEWNLKPSSAHLATTDPVAGVTTRHIEVTQDGATAVRAKGAELSLSGTTSYLAMTDPATGVQARYIDVVRGSRTGIFGPDGRSGLAIDANRVVSLASHDDRSARFGVGLWLTSKNAVTLSASRAVGHGYIFHLTNPSDGTSPYPPAMTLDETGLKLSGSRVLTAGAGWTDVPNAGMGTATGWALNSVSVREKNGVIQLTFAVIPNGNANAGEHTVATTNAALNALAAIRQQPLPWYAGGQSTLAGTSMWDKNDGRIYLKTTQTLPAGTTCYHSLTFI